MRTTPTTILLTIPLLVLALTIACSFSGEKEPKEPVGCPDVSTHNDTMTCGGQTYRTVNINGQVWMAENINYNLKGSRCYNDDEANCTIYGRMYNWPAAMKVCPAGWHLPSSAEWRELVMSVGGFSIETSIALKAKNGWKYNGNGKDIYGFSALPGGDYYDNNFGDIGEDGYWWSSSDFGQYLADFMCIYYYYEAGTMPIRFSNNLKGILLSVRCLRD